MVNKNFLPAVLALSMLSFQGNAQAVLTSYKEPSDAVTAYHIQVPEAAIADLRQRVAATRWPGKETVNDQSQGVKLEKIQQLVLYWGTQYDWRKAEAKLNALPQFV